MCDASCLAAEGPARPAVCIVSGSFGEGHDAAAREIQRRLSNHGIDAVIVDIVHSYPMHLGSLAKHVYLWQMKHIPRTWRWLLTHLESRAGDQAASDRTTSDRTTRSLAPLGRLGGRVSGREWARRAAIRCVGLAARRLQDLPNTFDAIVSTHPFASQAIGRLAAQGRMTGTASLTYLTDLSVHALWINPDVERHLALHEVAARDAARLGAHDIRIVRPAVRRATSAADPTRDVVAARAALGLPPTGRLALITGGAEGIGDLDASALDILDTTDLVPVVLCGRNETLRRRLLRNERIVALGWVTEMPSLYALVDVVVQNAGGSTSLEAIAAGVPMISYRCLPGHGETNAGNLERAGLVPWVRTKETLATTLAALDRSRPNRWTGDCVANVITETLRAS